MPKENKEPTSKPETAKTINKPITDSSMNTAIKKVTTPPINTNDKTLFLPIRSLKIPKGICEIILAAAKQGIINEIIDTS